MEKTSVKKPGLFLFLQITHDLNNKKSNNKSKTFVDIGK